MKDSKGIAVVTGTSAGSGSRPRSSSRAGHRVFAGMRNLAKAGPLREAAAKEELPVEVIELDVTSQDSVARAFAAWRARGPVEVLVNNAGIGGATPLELVPEAEHRQMFETNYFGAIRCIQAVLPEMRERQSGAIVNITSIAGLIATPNQIPYSASKFALECAGEALALEVRRFGIRVVNVEPGVIMTRIFENSATATRYDKNSPYKQTMRRNGKMFAAGFRARRSRSGRRDDPRGDHHAGLQAALARRQPTPSAWRRGGRSSATRTTWRSATSSTTPSTTRRYRRYFGIEL